MSESKKGLSFGGIVKTLSNNPYAAIGTVFGLSVVVTWLYKNRAENRIVKSVREFQNSVLELSVDAKDFGKGIYATTKELTSDTVHNIVDTIDDISDIHEIGDYIDAEDLDGIGFDGTSTKYVESEETSHENNGLDNLMASYVDDEVSLFEEDARANYVFEEENESTRTKTISLNDDYGVEGSLVSYIDDDSAYIEDSVSQSLDFEEENDSVNSEILSLNDEYGVEGSSADYIDNETMEVDGVGDANTGSIGTDISDEQDDFEY